MINGNNLVHQAQNIFFTTTMSSNNNSTARGRREVGWKIGHSRCEIGGSETIDFGNDEHPTLPAASPLPSVSCLLSGEELEGCLEASGSTKVDGQCWGCLRLFAGLRGLRVHQAKTKCGVAVESSARRCTAQDSVSVQRRNPDAIAGHSFTISSHGLSDSSDRPSGEIARTRCVVEEETAALQEVEARLPIKWPLMKETGKWESFDSKVHAVIGKHLKESGPDRLKLLQDTIYAEAVVTFCCVEPVARVGVKRNRRERKMGGLREDIRRIVRRMKRAPESEKYGLDTLLEEVKVKRNRLRRAENGRKRRTEMRRVRKAFYQNPFKAAKQMLSPRVAAQLSIPKAE